MPEPHKPPHWALFPTGPGVYVMRDAAHRILYIGKAVNLRRRVSSYFQKKDVGPKIQALVQSVRHVDYAACQSEREALVLEEDWIKKYQPVFNSLWKDDKSYPYVALSLQEDYPRLFLARKKHLPAGARAFGPYPSSGKIKVLIREIFRRGWIKLRPCRWDFSRASPLPRRIIDSCLYYHTGQCPAPCAGKILFQDYRKIAKKAEVFFDGNRTALLRHLRQEMNGASAALEYEKAQVLKTQIEAIEHIDERVTFGETSGRDLGLGYDPARATGSLRDALGLSVTPAHIEGFDISNIQGSHSVGSMVCFIDGKPNKSHYRRFKIRQVEGINDFEMIREVVGRRLRRLIQEHQPLPDLLLIDGGPGQLSAARKALNRRLPASYRRRPVSRAFILDSGTAPQAPGTAPLAPQVSESPAPTQVPRALRTAGFQRSDEGDKQFLLPHLCSLAKREEILYLDQGEENPPKAIALPKTHVGLKLAMWIRDEAHRFAISYHRLLRKKYLLPKNLNFEI